METLGNKGMSSQASVTWIRAHVCAVYASNTKVIFLSIIPPLCQGPSHQLTDPHGCEIQQVAGGGPRDAAEAQASEVNGPHLVLVVVQDAETAGALGGIRALRGQKRLRRAEGKRNMRGNKARNKTRRTSSEQVGVFSTFSCAGGNS